MRELTLTRETKRTVAARLVDAGATTARLTMQPNAPASRAAVCRAVGCDDATLLGWLDRLDTSPADPRSVTVPLGASLAADGEYAVRGFDGVTVASHRLPAERLMREVLPGLDAETLLCWGSRATLCCMDVDYHGTQPPPAHVMEAWVARVAPTPLAWHLSRGGGAHLFYAAKPPFTAEHLAAAAALRWLTIDPTAGVELKTQVRGPGAARVAHAPAGQDTEGALSRWIGADSVEADDAEEWLSAQGMERGMRYSHDRCPIAPDATGKRDPVSVGELGVYCHECAGKGKSLGSRAPGFAPWAALCGAPSSGEVGRMVRGMCHWGHAGQVLLHRYGLPEALARPAYEAALLAAHDGDARVAQVFHRDTEDMCRANDTWYSATTGYTYAGKIEPLIGTFPACVAADDKGKLRPVASTVALFTQGKDLSERGYTNLRVIRGLSLSKPFLPPPRDTIVPMPADCLRAANCVPRYVAAAGRRSTHWAEGVLERIFPRASWGVVRTLICACGVAQETRLGMQPLLFLAGASASAKTMTSMLAAAILGSGSIAVTYMADENRLRSAIRDGASKGCLVRADEFLKESRRQMRAAWNPRAALDPLLTLTPDTLYHALYLGARRMGLIPALVMTETLCPPSVKQYTQLARRIRYVQMHGSKRDWKESTAAAGLTGETMSALRLVSAEVNEACDVLVSDVIDRFFCVPRTWDSMADELGAPTIEDSPEFSNPTPQLLRLFQLVATTPPQVDRHATRYPAAKGWRRVSRHDQPTPDAQELFDLIDGFSDELGPNWGQSVVLSEKAWDVLLGTDEPVHIDLAPEGGSAVYVRFRVGRPAELLRLNGEIRDPGTLNVEAA